MKAIRLAALGAALVFGATSVAGAQQGTGQPPAGGMQRGMQAMFKGIDLTDSQKVQIDSIRAKYRAEMPPMQRGTPPDDATRAKRRELSAKQNDEIRAVLTSDQQKVFDANVKEMMERRRGGNGGGQ